MRKQRWDTSVNKVKRGMEVGGGVRDINAFLHRIPEDHGAKELYHVFGDFGNIKEVIIPPKKDVICKRYRFMRFLDMEDEVFLATKLHNIFIGRRKMHVNIPNHDMRKNMKQIMRKVEVPRIIQRKGHQNENDNERRMVQGNDNNRGIKTYAQVSTQYKQKPLLTHMEYNRDIMDLARF